MRILFFAPHPDDLEFFAGGLIVDHIRRGDEVFEVIVSHGERRACPYPRQLRRQREAVASAQLLGVHHVWHCNFPAHQIPYDDRQFRATVRAIIRRIKPETVYIPSFRNRLDFWIRDHRQLGHVLLTILRRFGLTDIRLHGTIRPAVLVDVSQFAGLIRRALRVHRSQWYLLRWYLPVRQLFVWLWGRRIGVRAAEGFSVA